MTCITRCVTLPVVFVFALAFNAGGEAVKITSYDIKSTPRSGYGCWSHVYSGTITDTGRTASDWGTCIINGTHIADYAGGFGTLSDNFFSTTTDDNQLFSVGLADDGSPILPEITLHLDGTFAINSILMFGGTTPVLGPPGALAGATVEISGVAVSLPTVPFGSQDVLGLYRNGAFVLTGTPLEGRPTNQIVLKNFVASFFGPFDHFSLTEIRVDAVIVPFSAFNAAAEIGRSEFELNGRFTLGTGSIGITPLTEAVTLQLGTLSLTIPRSSFKGIGSGRYEFEGTIGGTALEIQIASVTANSYTFDIEGLGADLTGTVDPVSVALTIGDDRGTTVASASHQSGPRTQPTPVGGTAHARSGDLKGENKS
jgi:hypothetical protein